MSEKSVIECEMVFDEGLHRINFNGNLKELSYMSILIVNRLRSEFMAVGFTDEQAKQILVGGIEKFWGDPETGGRSKNHEDLSE